MVIRVILNDYHKKYYKKETVLVFFITVFLIIKNKK